MWRDECVGVEATWGSAILVAGANSGTLPSGSAARAKEIDRELRRIAKHKVGLDVDEARWLREAERDRIWRVLGFSSGLEYLEEVFGYAPRTANDRLRVAKELEGLPELEAALRDGELPYSAARELTRVMTRETEAQWLARARGKNLRDIEELVAGHEKGAGPDDPKDPALMTRPMTFKLDARLDALLQQARAVLEDERGEHLDEAALLEAMCLRVLSASSASDSDQGKAKLKPQHQIVIRRCDDCRRAWQQGRGKLVPIAQRDIARAECDAEIVDEAAIEAAQAAGARRPKPTTTIPTKTRDLVMARDNGRCRFPGCRATRNLDVHHIEPRAHGGGHDTWNLLVLCSGHHQLLHDEIVTIRGRAPDALVFTRDGRQLVDARAPGELRACAIVRDAGPANRDAHATGPDAHATGPDAQLRGRDARAAGPDAQLRGRDARAVGRDAGAAVRDAEPSGGESSRTTEASTRRSAPQRTRFEDVVRFEDAKKALRQLGWTAAAAKRALDDVRAHVGADADAGALVRAALHVAEKHDTVAHEAELPALAKQALVQLGFSATIADEAVRAARAHVGTDATLEAFIKEALRNCT